MYDRLILVSSFLRGINTICNAHIVSTAKHMLGTPFSSIETNLIRTENMINCHIVLVFERQVIPVS